MMRAAAVRRLSAAWALSILCSMAGAQTLDDVQIRSQGDTTVARVTFNATVRVLRQSPTTPASLYRVAFDLIAADDSVMSQTIEESKRIAASGSMPDCTLTYSPSQGGNRVRELTVVLATNAPLRVQQGPTSRTIDFVFLGPGRNADADSDASKPAASPAATAPAEPMPAPAAPTASTPRATPEQALVVETKAAELMTLARTAMSADRPSDAIAYLDQLLLLPPNQVSQEAQEQVGVAWERAGDPHRAQVEYALYLRLYPNSDGAARVAQRLQAMGVETAAPASPAASAGAETAAATPDRNRRFTGNVAQYYYGGKARSQSLVNLAAGIDQSTLTTTTESAIVTSVDLGARFASTDAETRVVVRGTNSANLQSNSHSASQLSAAYVDYKRNDSGLAVRIGRQSSISGGLLGFFDGVSMAYPFATGWKVDLMGGVPANPLVSAPSERLLAAMVEADGIFDRWGGDVYLIDQTTEGITNRRALGGELRYSDEDLSVYSLLDYDILFRKLNAVSLQGSFQAPGQTTVTMLVDDRNAPSLQLTNALISSGAVSLKTLLQMQSLEQVKADALATTAKARQLLLSASRPLAEKWQFSTDFRYSDIGALPAVGNFDATPATGSQYGVTVQFTGSNLYSQRDINNFNFSYLTSPTFKGAQLAYNNLTGLRDNDLTLEPSLRLYRQRDDQGVKLVRITPGMRATYRISRRVSVLGEGIVEHSTTNGSTGHDTTNSVFFYVGYRYELF